MGGGWKWFDKIVIGGLEQSVGGENEKIESNHFLSP